jgi:hypothetical protein
MMMNFMKYSEEIDMKYLVLFILSGAAYADDKEEEPKVVYKQRTEIDFEGVEIEGELVKPQGSLVLDRRHAKFNPMIKLRTDFDDEMDKSVDEIK